MRSCKQEPTGSDWFPLSLERYDRNPALTPGETTALQRHAHEHHPAKTALHDQVRRLIEPVEDLFSHTTLRPTVRPFLVLYLLREMNRRGRSFWGWTTEEWIQTINNHHLSSSIWSPSHISFADLLISTQRDRSLLYI